MQDNITSDQLVEATLAFALSSLFQLLYAYWNLIVSLFRWLAYGQRIQPLQPNWAQLCSSVAFVLGGLFAGLFVAARDGYQSIPPHTAYPFFLAWKGVSLISLAAFELIVVIIPLKDIFVKLGAVLVAIGVMAPLAHTAVGIWQLAIGGSEFVWAAPVYLHAVSGIIILAEVIAKYRSDGRLPTRKGMCRFACWVCFRLAASVLSVVSAAYGWECQHLIQCSVGVVIISEYRVWKALHSASSDGGALPRYRSASSNDRALARSPSAASTLTTAQQFDEQDGLGGSDA